MSKMLKWLGICLAVIVGLLLILILFIGASPIPSYDIEPITYRVSTSPESLARGEKLASMLCANCHLNKETGKLSGTKMMDAPPEFGEIYSQNITQDKEYGIGSWTDAELLYLLRTGIKKDGQYSPPYMAKLPLMADEDVNAIIAFLRSDHKLVTADPTPDTPSEPSVLTKFLSRVAWKPFPMPGAPIGMPDTTDLLVLGEYLAHNLDCYSCHSADFKTNDFLNPPNSEGYFGGGNQPLNLEGQVMLTANLTPDKETGIGNWSKEQFISAVKYGVKEGEDALTYPMIPYTQLSDREAGAIFEYLKSIPPIKNAVERSVYE